MNEFNASTDAVVQSVCPLCRTQVSFAPSSTRCPRCGLDVTDARAVELHQLNLRIGVDSARRLELETSLRADLGWAMPGPAATTWGWPSDVRSAPSVTSSASHEVSEVSARNLILGIGVALLGVALAVFVAVTWPRLGPSGRVAFLVVATGLVVGATGLAAQRRLASTVEALSALTVILLLANSYAIRQGWFLDADPLVYWAVATAISVASVTLFNAIVHSRALVFAALVGAQAPLCLIALSLADRVTEPGFVLVLQALATTFFGRNKVDYLAKFASLLAWALFVVGALATFQFVATGVDPTSTQLALGVAVGAVAAVLARLQDDEQAALLYWAFGAIALVVSTWELTDLAVQGPARLGVGSTVLLVIVALWSRTSGTLRRGTFGVLVAVNGLLFLPILATLFTVAVLPFSWLGYVWQLSSDAVAKDRVGVFTETCIGRCPPVLAVERIRYESWQGNWWQIVSLVLLTVAAGIFLGGVKKLEARNVALITGCGAALWLAIVAVGGSHLVTTLALATVVLAVFTVSFSFSDNHQIALIVGATLALANVLAWTLAAQTSSVSVFVTVSVGLLALSAVALARQREMVSYTFVTLCMAVLGASLAVIGRANDWSWTSIGVELAVLYATICLLSLLLERDARYTKFSVVVQCLGAAGFFVGVALQQEAAAVSLMLAGATAIALFSALRCRHLVYWSVTAALGLASIWAALIDQTVSVVQAYTVPAAVVVLIFGYAIRCTQRISSWARYGVGVSALVGPALFEALATESLGYLGWASAVALGVLLVGVAMRLQAPLTVGAVGLIAIAVRLLGPYADDVPRWLVIGVPGLLLIVVGATWEQRRADVNKLVAAYQKLG